MPVESASRRCLLDWAWILSKRRIPHIAAVLDDIVCTALCDISDMFRRVLLATSISISCRKFTNVRSCCAGVPSSSLHPLSLHTAPQPGEACPQFASPAIEHSRNSHPRVKVIVLGPCTRFAGACWVQLLANQFPLQLRSHPVATHPQVVTVNSHTRTLVGG